MGGRFGRKRNPTVDPFYEVPPPVAYGEPAAPFLTSDPLEEYGYEYQTSSIQTLYGRPNVSSPNVYVNFYAQGFNQMPSVAPWNYGNYFLGNTAMQMMPGDLFGSSWMSPCCLPSSFSMPLAAPMMAAATALPVAFNPLVQGMYPMASESPVNWMNPSSFMSALSSGPMPYRPPGIDFPSNVGAIMTIPYGTPNPLLSTPFYGSFSGAGSTPYAGAPPVTGPAPPPVSYYARPTSVPQPYPVPYRNPVPVHSVQQLPTPGPAPVVAPPRIICCNQAPSHQVTSSLSNQGVNNYALPISVPGQGVYQTSAASSQLCSDPTVPPILHGELISDSGWLPAGGNGKIVSDSGWLPAAGHGKIVSDSGWLPAAGHGKVVSDSGWLPKKLQSRVVSSIFAEKKRKQTSYPGDSSRPIIPSKGGLVSFQPGRRVEHSSSSVSESDCPICQQQHDLRRLRENYGSSTVSSLVSSPRESRRHNLKTYESNLSPTTHGSTSSRPGASKPHRRHPIQIKSATKTPSPKPSTSPIFLRKSPIAEASTQPINKTIDEEYVERENMVKNVSDNTESASEKSD